MIFIGLFQGLVACIACKWLNFMNIAENLKIKSVKPSIGTGFEPMLDPSTSMLTIRPLRLLMLQQFCAVLN